MIIGHTPEWERWPVRRHWATNQVIRYGGLVFHDASHHDAQLLVDLINSRYLGDGSDVLADTGATRWLREHIGQYRRMPAASALLPLRELREGLRQLAIG